MHQDELLKELSKADSSLNKISQGIADGVEFANYGYLSDKIQQTINLGKHVLSQAKAKKKESKK